MKILRKAGILALVVAGCASTQTTGSASQPDLEARANSTLGEMIARDPGLADVVHDSYAYAVFPEVGKAGALVAGGAYGRGVLFERGQAVGDVKLEQASLGPQIGGETISELLVIKNKYEADMLKAGNFQLGADASAIILTAGAESAADFQNGYAVFVLPRGGAMAGLSITGQHIDFEPAG